MKEVVRHTGQVVSVTPQLTTVRIVSHSACSSCHAAGLCGLSEFTEKAVQVPTPHGFRHAVGDEVQVALTATMGLKAVWLAYFLPLVLLLSLTLGLIALGVGEVAAVLSGLALLGLYYLVLWLFRDRLRNEHVFTISTE